MIEKGYIYISCDRCGADTYFKPQPYVKEGELITDERPKGWVHIGFRDKDLCPKCAIKYKAMLDNFFEGETNDN